MHPFSAPWLISEEGLRLVLAISSRERLFPDELQRAREAYQARHGEEFGNKKYSRDVQVQDGVMVLPIRGPLVRHAAMFSDISGATSYDQIGKDLRAGLDDPAIRQIVLLVDSPGGEANGCGELAGQIRAASKKKPVMAYVEGACASAAYWLSAAASKIYCSSTAMLGSIGCRMAILDESKALEKTGVKQVEIVSSQSPGKRGTPIDDEVIGRVQTRIDDLAAVFISDVARMRGVSVEKVITDFGGGDCMIGEKAVKAGLADRLGSLDELLAQLRGPQTRTYTMTTPPALVAQETELVPKAELVAAQARNANLEEAAASVKPLLQQVADITGQAGVQEQQTALALLVAKAAQADQQIGDERAQLLQKAKDKKIPPVAMAGWEHLSLPSLREVVEKTQGIQPKQAAEGQGSEPAQAEVKIELTALDRSMFAAAGITDEAVMIKAKRDALEGK